MRWAPGQNHISDEDLKSYLLGELPQPARAQLEERYLSDDATYERLLAVEEELIDHHVQGLLSPRQWEPVKRSLLLAEDGLERLRLARALGQLRLQSRQSLSRRLADGLREWSSRKVLAPAAIGAAVLLVFVAFRRDFLPQNGRPELTDRAPDHTDQPLTRDVSPTNSARSSTVTLFLRSVSRDDSTGNILRISRGQDRVRLEAEVPGDARKTYHIAIRRPDGGQIQTSADIVKRTAPSGNLLISADFNSDSFQDGDYIFTVLMETGSHTAEEVIAYGFSVVREEAPAE
jgi:hypothetical protein